MNLDKYIVWGIMKDSIEWYSKPNTDSIKMCQLRLVCKQFKEIIDKFFVPCEVCEDVRMTYYPNVEYPSLGMCIKDGTLKDYNKCKTCGACYCRRCRENSENDAHLNYPDLSEICPWCFGY